MPKLTKILKTACKTINLAKPQTYQIPRKPPLNSLVFEKLAETKCGEKIVSKPLAPTPVRVCTKEELKAMYCCPPPCDCNAKKPPLKLGQKIAHVLLVLGKSMIVGALIYITWAEGLWSDSDHSSLLTFLAKIIIIKELIRITWKEGLWSDAFHSSCLLGKFVRYCPEQKEEEFNEFADASEASLPPVEPCFPFIPRIDYALYNFGYYWNKVVITIFWLVMDAPREFWEFLKSLFRKKKPVKVLEPCDEMYLRRRKKLPPPEP